MKKRKNKLKMKWKMSVWQSLSLGYLVTILLGSVLLILPFATAEGQSTSYINALFTSASATCVTGLIPYDTGIHWSLFGQIVILLLIQTGGIGFMTFVSVGLLVVRRGLRVSERTILAQSLNTDRVGGVRKLIRRIFIGSFLIEAIGAGLLAIRFVGDYGAWPGLWFSVFHAVSAFCNAGFDVLGSVCGEYASLSAYAADPLVALTICGLIIIGGLGFCVWGDMIDCKGNPVRFQLYTKLILIATSVLLVGGTALFLIFERNGAGANFWEKLLLAFFHATTARTAGFSVTDLNALSDSGYALMIVLMFIGGATGSTAGGIKVGTVAVILMGMYSVFRSHRDINIGKRRVNIALLPQALTIFAAYIMLTVTSVMFICAIDAAAFKAVLFEVVSALNTVGLSLGITPALNVGSKIVLILLMYTGRVGILTLGQAIGAERQAVAVRKPVGNFYIG